MAPEKKPPQKPQPQTTLDSPTSQEPALRKEFEHDIYRAWCKECGLCAAFCPKGVIKLDDTGAPVIAHPERCTGCGWCELHCPDFAISVREFLAEKPKEEAD
jgi:2-oxoglutarate ferredoxin oxidoreductase subunit delta